MAGINDPVLTASLLWAQESVYKLNVNVDLTEVHVNVTDEKDHPIGNLKKVRSPTSNWG